MEEILSGAFQPNSYNGTWTSDTVLTFRRGNGDLVQYDVLKKETKVLVTSTTFVSYRRVLKFISSNPSGLEGKTGELPQSYRRHSERSLAAKAAEVGGRATCSAHRSSG